MVLGLTGLEQENKTVLGFGHLVSGILTGTLTQALTVPCRHVTTL